MDRIQVDILGLSTSPASGGAYALILKEVSGNRRLPIIIGAFEAQSIALEMEGIKPPRPLTHDLMKNILETLGSDLAEITISELRDGTFYAKLSFDSREIDARPSDAIALAVRFGAPIFVSEKVMEEASFLPEEEQEPSEANTMAGSKPKETKLTRLEALRAQLKDAVEREDYEKAAKLRDEIRTLEQRH
ncbi:MAG: bifunctional nuclease family protein [Ignavibacteriae bacterium]|nr:bifunctional nuclease family protein [Ignavibacteria bacterium]MBI3364299.1 bifunctional nuclease family protein [Ignavibacteriota bacterium]